jgi:hypothetical protein
MRRGGHNYIKEQVHQVQLRQEQGFRFFPPPLKKGD